MKDGIKYKDFYFFVMLSVAGEPVTNAMRFKYFLVDVWTNAKTESYEIEEKAEEKIKKITALLSQEHNVQYEIAYTDKITNTAYNVLKKYFPHYNEDAHAIDTSGDSDDEEEEED
jgi:metal-dependent amidase/aminoacylase/carboxypeptidase family protein